ncbi:MFS transporter [Metasolibacillus meyeri]|uniref:MFS transporter n=1 Tax=Metasolibacillus meyeri TaxID=1071052 RepID=A0AAW9NXD4_9BACL|nr:MFS transporter [Metasolibacillus meyeri]MEC1179153.1 MFS transporter [Metasolibacillus meyeri]
MNLYRNRNFLLLYIGTIASTIGYQLYHFILPLFIYDLTKSALAMSTMRIIDFLPNVLLGMLAGVLVDRMNRNVMLKYAGFVKALLATVLTVIILLDAVQLWHMYILGFLIATVSYTFGNAQHAIVPQLFEKSLMTEIQAKFSFVNTLLSIVGPSIAGMLLIFIAYDYLFIVYALSLVAIWLSVFFLDATATPERPNKQSILADMKEGFVELLGNKALFYPTIAILFANLATSFVIGVQVFYVVDVLQETKEQLGFMYSIAAVGGLVGAKLLQPLRKKWTRGKIFTTVYLMDSVVLLLFFFATTWWQLGILLAVRTCTSVIINIIYLAIRQESTPNHLLGRVAGTSSMFMKLALPAGLFVGGLWAEMLPIPYIFLLSAGIVLAIYVVLSKQQFSLIE